MRESRSVLAALLGLALLLSGCASIPSDGETGVITVEDQAERVQSEVEPEGPVEGADPNAIVRGFLAAGAGHADDFAVARSFLTDDFAKDWDPESSVLVMPASADFDTITSEVSSDQQNISLTLPVDATLDEQRVYSEEKSGTEVDRDFTLRQVNGEWRISQAPQGMVLTASSFSSVFDSYPLYFYTPGFDYLVPDTRWFIRSPATATQVMTELLTGPADHLSGAVISALPDGTLLDPRSVTVSDGIAQVGLDENAQGLDDATRTRILDQVSTTLRGLSSTNAVEVSTPAGPLSSPPGDAAPVGVRIDDQPVLIADGTLALLDETRLDPIPDLPDLGKGPSDPAVSMDGGTYAYLARDQQELHRILPDGGGDAVLRTSEDGLTGPSFDLHGGLWTAERTQGGRGGVSVLLESGDSVDIAVPWLAGRTVRAAQVSRDGTQLAVLSRGSRGSTRIDVVGIVRGADGVPSGVVPAEPRRLGARFDTIIDLSWAGSDTLVILAGNGEEAAVQPYLAPLSGPTESLGDVSGGTAITATTDARTIRVSTAAGELYSYSAGNWQKVIDLVVHDPSYPG